MAATRSLAGPGSGIAMPALGAFLAGVVSVLVFHQIAFWLLNQIHVAPANFYNLTPTKPFGVPVVLSLAFWGGLWAIPLAWLLRRRYGTGYWVFATLFGAVAATLVAWFIVPMLKGLPTIVERPLSIAIIIGPVVNGAWGFGTAVFLKLLPARWSWRG